MNRYLVWLGLSVMVAVSGAPTAVLADALEQRVQRLEQILNSQSLSDLVLEMHQLRREVQQLRGEIEVQQHTLDNLRKQQRQQYMDLDKRLGEASSGRADAEAPGAAQPEPAPSAPPPVPGSRDLPPPEGPGAAQPSAPVARPSAGSEEEAYQRAFDLLQQGKYEPARAEFEALLSAYPAGRYADNARYWLGETCYVQKDYPRALDELNRLIADHPQSPKIPGALLKIGYIHEAQGDPAKAAEVLRQLVEKYPGTTEARLAKSRLEKMAK